jgi:nitrite reductase/ring-hydroxylating ferredoxin subunit
MGRSCSEAVPSGCSGWVSLGSAEQLLSAAAANGGKLEVGVAESRVLLVLDDSAGGVAGLLQARCSHYGAPLAKGVVCAGRVVCPWHAAAFDGASGTFPPTTVEPSLSSALVFRIIDLASLSCPF